MNDGPQKLSLDNICGGAAQELFERALAELVDNINDPNTKAEQKRGITLQFTFSPFPDRSGATVTFDYKSKLASVNAVKGNAFFSRRGGQTFAFSRDPRQTALFASEPTVSEAKQ